jgi:hypothetical protein
LYSDRGVPLALVRLAPREPLVLDEVRVAPSEQYRNRQTVGQAKNVLKHATSGRPVAERDLERLQQRLLTIERQAQLAGRPSEGGADLAEQLGELRRAQLRNSALDLVDRAKKGQRLDEKQIVKVQQRLLQMERQDQLSGQESEGMQLARALGEVRRQRVVADANAVLARATKGGRTEDRRIERLQQRLLGMERQDELSGQDSEGRQLANALSEVRRTQAVHEAMALLNEVKQGRIPSQQRIARVQRRLVEMERQDELSGRESEGMRLARELAAVRR